MKEEWRDIKDYENIYRISNKGRVLSLKREVLSGGCVKKKTIGDRVLKSKKQDNGYVSVTLSKNAKTKQFLVHRLVALAFLEKQEQDTCVNHKDGVKDNNIVSNLEWTNDVCNAKHAIKNELIKTHWRKLSDEQIEKIISLYINSDKTITGICSHMSISVSTYRSVVFSSIVGFGPLHGRRKLKSKLRPFCAKEHLLKELPR